MKTIRFKNIKKLTSMVMTLIFLLQGMSMLGFAEEGGLSQATIPVVTIQNNRAQVKLRDVAETIGLNVAYEASTKKITFTNSETEIVFHVGNKQYTVNGEVKQADTAPAIFKNQTIVPVRVVSEAFDIKVTYNPQQKQVVLEADSLNQIEVEEQAAANKPQGSYKLQNNEDLKLITAQSINSLVVDGTKIPLYKKGNKVYATVNNLEKALINWDTMGKFTNDGSMLVIDSGMAYWPDNKKAESRVEFHTGLVCRIYPQNGKFYLDGTPDPFQTDPLVKFGGHYGLDAVWFIRTFQLGASIDGDVLSIYGSVRGSTDGAGITYQQRLEFINNYEPGKILADVRPGFIMMWQTEYTPEKDPGGVQ